MVLRKKRFLFLSLISGLGLVLLLIGLLGASPASAYQRPSEWAQSESVPLATGNFEIRFAAVFTDPAAVDILDLGGNSVTEGTHSGSVRCNQNNCNQRIDVVFNPADALTYPLSFEYRFTTRQAVDPEDRKAVVAGTGTIDGGGMKERFLFTATFEDNRDGSISVTYVASRPDASFIIPRTAGIMTFASR